MWRIQLAAVAVTIVGCMAGNGGDVQVGSTHLSYDIKGRGTTVVLIPGANVDRRILSDLADVLAADHRVVSYDPRGYGRSGPWGEPYRAADDLIGLLDALKIDQAAVVGLSLGGRIALDATTEYPERFSSLVLLSPGLSGYEWSADGYEWYAAVADAASANDTTAIVNGWLESPFMRSAAADPNLRALLARLTTDNIEVWLTADSEVGYPTPAIDQLNTIRVPALIIVGDRDSEDSRRIADVLSRRITDSELVSLPGVGHLPHLEAPDTTAASVVRFLADSRPRF